LDFKLGHYWISGRSLTLPPILVGQSCCFALIEVSAKGDASANGQAKTSLRSFCGGLGVAAATPYQGAVRGCALDFDRPGICFSKKIVPL
jgi:hypothetical protein